MNIDNRTVKSDSPKRWIETLQRQLIRENPSALPEDGINGELGSETVTWIERFQERKGLEVDGVASPETLGRLRADIIYRPGDSGEGVKLLQEDLMYFTVELAHGASGEYEGGTKQGVKDFQYFNFMDVDGIAGPDTIKKIDELYETILIQPGDEGAHVRRIQKQLNEQDNVDISITVDGGYGEGPGTEEAVREFQKAMELDVDGIVGPRTMYLLDAESSPLFNNEEMKEELENLGLTFDDSSDSDHKKFSNLFRNHPKIIEAVGGQDFKNIYTTEMDYPNGSKDNEIVIVVADVEEKPNLALSAQFFKKDGELRVFSVMDIFGNLPEDDVEIKTYMIDDDGTSVDKKTERSVDLEDSLLQSQITFQKAIQKSKETNADLAVLTCDDEVILSSQKGISTQDWTDIIGITCNIAVSVSGNVLGSSIAAAFGLSTGPLGVTALITTVIAAVGSYYFCSWLEDQF
jgi:peptidoglycan hydrolase-like protein with peptidoglycan-binding domain